MNKRTDVHVNQRTLDDAVKDAFAIIGTSYADNVINKSDKKDVIRKAMALFLGTYRAVKGTIKEAGLINGIAYFNGEALLDTYSSYIAANESLAYLSSEGIAKSRDTKPLFRNGITFLRYEKELLLREKLFVGELLSNYYEVSDSLSPGMLGDFTINYFEWLIIQAVKNKDLISFHEVFDENVGRYSIILPSKDKKGRRYEGLKILERIVSTANTKANEMKKGADSRPYEQYHFLMKKLPPVTFADVGGLEYHKSVIYDAIKLPIEKREKFLKKGIEATKGLIFYGAKGCWKTFIAKAIANEMKLPFFYVSGSQLVNKYVGVGGDIIRQLFDDAKSIAPSIVFIDEVDACLINRDTQWGTYVREQVNQMLVEIDGFHPLGPVKVIVATNFYDILDGNFRDRFPPKYHLEFSLPDEKMRFEVIKAITKRQLINGVDLGALAKLTDGINSRAIFHICNEAGLYSIKEDTELIEQRHFDLALADYRKDPKKYGGIK